jgi:DNA replication protein DnaC
VGGTGSGKTHLAIALASQAIKNRYKARFFNVVDLVNRLEAEKSAGNAGKLAERLKMVDVVVLDELGYLPFSQAGGALLFGVLAGNRRNFRTIFGHNRSFRITQENIVYY